MGIEVEERAKWLEVRLRGRADCFNLDEMQATLEGIADNANALALELSDTEFLNMKMIQFVHKLAIEKRAKGGSFALVGASEKLKKQFRVFASLDPMMTFSSTEWVNEVQQSSKCRA